MNPLKGIIPALLTACNEDGSICDEGICEIIENGIRCGIGGIFALGSCGEFTAYTLEEKAHILDVIVSQVAGRVPVIAGCGAPTTREVLRLCEMAASHGVDAVAVVTPYYIAPTQEDLYEHYRIISENSPLPILLYNIPPRTGLCITPELLGRLVSLPNIVGIKDSSGDIELFKQYMAYNSDTFQVIMGIDALFLEAFKLGAPAAVSGPANSIPANQVKIYESYVQGDMEAAEQAQNKFLKLKPILGMAPGPTIAKEAANIVGLHAGPPCSPLRRPSGEVWEKLNAVLHSEFSDCFVK
ncbi:4-hydroxy-tetrahydrodipicolinate synthase [Oscillibacter sp. PC13]|uniref:4-hydroxy-tetrahydrodipicolinate synthase n=1 Tax=Oscillibacter sp. PC13 TaxID=1855299 RepID=UPI0008EF8EEA|nr:4-hydroxy-tetrahydrodipicolinate synthase [Oscillibacter sp. PC13]SFP37109.1 4-hydroxy-tetrahydrodipicolinate synthase [Oscillibacter sp. PC13]